MVASVIFRQRRLRNPRNTFWLGIVFCNLLAQTNALMEYAAFELMNALACAIFRVTAGIPYTVIQLMLKIVIFRTFTLRRYSSLSLTVSSTRLVAVGQFTPSDS